MADHMQKSKHGPPVSQHIYKSPPNQMGNSLGFYKQSDGQDDRKRHGSIQPRTDTIWLLGAFTLFSVEMVQNKN